ncbi:MAG: VOC family protein, partial [Acidimicrobiales bacterium]|nr:VOC family protein [Acidimicrobiales bacterium]
MPLDDARIFHVNVNCRSLESSRHFYTDGLGLTEGFRTTPESAQPAASLGLDHGRWDASILLGANGFDGGAIDLLQWLEPAAGGAPPGRPEQCGYQRIGITVPDLDAAVGRLGRTGGSSWGPPFPVERPDGREAVVALATDPDGTAVELVAGSATRLAFVAVCCADLERSVAFYQALGFVLLARSVSRFDDGSRLHIEGPVASRVVVL